MKKLYNIGVMEKEGDARRYQTYVVETETVQEAIEAIADQYEGCTCEYTIENIMKSEAHLILT